MYFHTRVKNGYVVQRLFGGGLRRISSGYLFLRVTTVPDVHRDVDFGSTAFIIAMVSSRSLGPQRMMHHPSEHWTTRGSKGRSDVLNLAINVSLVSDPSTVNAMYLLLPRLDLTTIVHHITLSEIMICPPKRYVFRKSFHNWGTIPILRGVLLRTDNGTSCP